MSFTKERTKTTTVIWNTSSVMDHVSALDSKHQEMVYLRGKKAYAVLTKYERRRLDELEADYKLARYIELNKK